MILESSPVTLYTSEETGEIVAIAAALPVPSSVLLSLCDLADRYELRPVLPRRRARAFFVSPDLSPKEIGALLFL